MTTLATSASPNSGKGSVPSWNRSALAELEDDIQDLLKAYISDPVRGTSGAAFVAASLKLQADYAFDVANGYGAVASAPNLVAASTSRFLELLPSGTSVAKLSSENNQGIGPVTFSIVGGADASSFSVSGDRLLVTGPIEMLAHPTLSVDVRATDASGRSFDQVLTFSETLNHAPTSVGLTSSTVAAGAPAGTIVGTLTSTDGDPGDTRRVYKVVGGADRALFTVDQAGRLVATKAVSTTRTTESVEVEVTDGGGRHFDQTLSVSVVSGLPAPPTGVVLASGGVKEGAVGAFVGTLSAVDPIQNQTFTYSILPGANGSDFSVSASGRLTSAVALAFDADPVEHVNVQVTDSYGRTSSSAVEVDVLEVPTAPSSIALSAPPVSENAAPGAFVGTVSATKTHVGDVLSYSIVGGRDAAALSLSGTTLSVAGPLDHNAEPVLDVVLRATNQYGLHEDGEFQVAVADAGPTTGIGLNASSVAEQAAPGTVVGLLSSVDPSLHDTFTYALVGGDSTDFSIQGNRLTTNGPIDWVTEPAASVVVESIDNGGGRFDQTFSVSVTHLYGPTAIVATGGAVADGAPVGTVAASLSAVMPDAVDVATFSVIGGVDASQFAIRGSSLVTTVPESYVMGGPTRDVIVRAVDLGGLFHDADLSIAISPPSGVPDISTVTLSDHMVHSDENPGFLVGHLGSDVAATYRVVGGADGSQFTVDSNDDLVTTTSLNALRSNTRDVVVEGTDARGVTADSEFTIGVVQTSLVYGDGQINADPTHNDVFQPAFGGVADISGFSQAGGDELSLADYLSQNQIDAAHVRLVGVSDAHLDVQVNDGGGTGWNTVASLEAPTSVDGLFAAGASPKGLTQPQIDGETSAWIGSQTIHA